MQTYAYFMVTSFSIKISGNFLLLLRRSAPLQQDAAEGQGTVGWTSLNAGRARTSETFQVIKLLMKKDS